MPKDNYEYVDVYRIEKKEGSNPKAPDYKMMTNIEGTYTEIMVGWIKESKSGTKYISFSKSKPKTEAPKLNSEGNPVPFI